VLPRPHSAIPCTTPAENDYSAYSKYWKGGYSAKGDVHSVWEDLFATKCGLSCSFSVVLTTHLAHWLASRCSHFPVPTPRQREDTIHQLEEEDRAWLTLLHTFEEDDLDKPFTYLRTDGKTPAPRVTAVVCHRAGTGT
jgi:hypothetical protein